MTLSHAKEIAQSVPGYGCSQMSAVAEPSMQVVSMLMYWAGLS